MKKSCLRKTKQAKFLHAQNKGNIEAKKIDLKKIFLINYFEFDIQTSKIFACAKITIFVRC